MADNLQSGMAQPDLPSGSIITLEALDPTTGLAVSGVIISDVVISGLRVRGGGDLFIEVGAPLYTPGPNA